MARVGACNFKQYTSSPVAHDSQWRGNIAREQWDHPYHAQRTSYPLQSRPPCSTNQDALNVPWRVLSHVPSSAAGVSSWHWSAAKPWGNIVHQQSTGSAAFENAAHAFAPWEIRRTRSVCNRSSRSRGGASQASSRRSHSVASARQATAPHLNDFSCSMKRVIPSQT